MSEVHVRAAEAGEIDRLARVWYDGWQDAHAMIMPAELTRARTLESFRERLHAALADVRVVGPRGDPVGFYIVKGDELYQLFVSASARGTGVAAALIADAEDRLAASGIGTAWLACAIGNERAARFYEKCGWRRTRTMLSQLKTVEGTFSLKVWRYEKVLAPLKQPAN
jgi:GNAT superfamily N-acetyltransferase